MIEVWEDKLEADRLLQTPAEINRTSRARDSTLLFDQLTLPNNDDFLDIHERQTNPESGKYPLFAHLNLWAALFQTPWFFYRKMYKEGAAIFLAQILIGIFAQEIAVPFYFGIVFLTATRANWYYVRVSRKKVFKILEASLPEEQRADVTNSVGGITKFGAVFASIFPAYSFISSFIIAFQSANAGN
jgi:hypothetical protein